MMKFNKEHVRTGLKWGAGLVTAVFVAPYVMLAIGGIVGLAVAGALGLVIIHGAPWPSMKLANLKVWAIVEEAKENPVETMTNLIYAKKQAFEKFCVAVETAVTARDNFARKCTEFSKKYPARAEEFNQRLVVMAARVEEKKQALNEARVSIRTAEEKLEEMRAYMDMAVALQQANEKTGMNTGDLYEKMKADIAVDSVFDNVNRAFAQLEVAASLANEPENDIPALTNNTSPMLVQDLRVHEKVKA